MLQEVLECIDVAMQAFFAADIAIRAGQQRVPTGADGNRRKGSGRGYSGKRTVYRGCGLNQIASGLPGKWG